MILNGGAGADVLNLNDQGDGSSNTYTVTATTISRNGTGAITTSADLETRNLNGGTGTNTYNISGTSSGTSLFGGASGESFVFADAAALGESIDGGGGTDVLNYTSDTTGVSANLGLNTTGLTSTLDPNQEVSPATSAATGTAAVSNYDLATRTFDINVTVTNFPPADVTGFHLDSAAFGINGPNTR